MRSASTGLVATGGGVVAVTGEGLIHCCSPRFVSAEIRRCLPCFASVKTADCFFYAGCMPPTAQTISRPERQHHSKQECRYLRLEGLKTIQKTVEPINRKGVKYRISGHLSIRQSDPYTTRSTTSMQLLHNNTGSLPPTISVSESLYAS